MPPIAPNPGLGFPIAKGHSVSYWQHQVKDDDLLEYGAKMTLPENVDTVIIGSGITGCLIAKSLVGSEPSKSVVVVEARGFCSGATGRNAGHCKSSSFKLFPKYEQEFGAEEAIKILQNEEDAQRALVAYVQEHGVDCDLWTGDSYDVPMTPSVALKTNKAFSQYRDAGGVVDHIKVTTDPASAAKLTGLKNAQACYARPAATLQPWKLAAHIMRDCLAKGVMLRTFTVVRSVARLAESPSKWSIGTDRGNIDCKQVIHATNAYTGAHEPLFRNLVRPYTHICNQVTPPNSFSEVNSFRHSLTALLPDGASVSVNPRCSLDGTILLGGDNPGQRIFERWLKKHPELAVDDSFTNVDEVTKGMQDFARAEFYGWNEVGAIEDHGSRSWSGILGMSPDRMPYVGEIPGKKGQWICVALNGYGMTKVFTVAPGLAQLANGVPWEETGLPRSYGLTSERIERLNGKGFARSE